LEHELGDGHQLKADLKRFTDVIEVLPPAKKQQALRLIKNGCPGWDPRKNFAGLDALRKGQEFNEKIGESPQSKTRVVWEPLRSLGGSY
jgi:hypothetical protein